MTGKDNGVAAILKKTHCPHMITVHCVAHRLALARVIHQSPDTT